MTATDPRSDGPRFSIVGVVAPLFLGVVLTLITGRPETLVFAVLAPVLAVGSVFESRRRLSRDLPERVARHLQSATRPQGSALPPRSPELADLVAQAVRRELDRRSPKGLATDIAIAACFMFLSAVVGGILSC